VNAEQQVISDIDALIDECMAPGPVDDYSVNRYDRCDTCSSQWHGLEDEDNGCPGAFATDNEIEAFRSRYSSHRPARPGSPWALSELPTGTRIDGSINYPFGYTLADVEAMRGGFSPARSGTQMYPNPTRHPNPLTDDSRWTFRFPRVRFWATGDDGTIQEIEGTLHIGSLDYSQGAMSIEGSLLPPIIQRQIPLREQSIAAALGDVLEDADLTITAQTWIRGEEETQDARPVTPVGEMQGGYISAELAMAPGAGFEPLGYIRPDEFEITTDTEFVESWSGRTVRSYETTTVSFDCVMDRGPAWDALIGGSPP